MPQQSCVKTVIQSLRQNIPVSNWLSGVLIIFSCVNMIFWLARVHSCIDLVFRSFLFMLFNQLKQYFTITSVLSEKKVRFSSYSMVHKDFCASAQQRLIKRYLQEGGLSKYFSGGLESIWEGGLKATT